MTWGIRWKVFCFFSLCTPLAPATPQKENKMCGGKCVPERFLKTPLSCRITLETVAVGVGGGQDTEGTRTSTPHIPGLFPSTVTPSHLQAAV